MPSKPLQLKTTIRNKIMFSFVLMIVVWGMLNSALLENALHTILVREGLASNIVAKICHRFVTISTGLTILAITVFHVAGYFFSRNISLPIKNLTEGIASIADGNLDVRIDVSSSDELGHLAQTFNGMVEELAVSTVSRQYLTGIFESMINTLMVLSPDGKIRTVNRAFLDLLAYREEEVVGLTANAVIAEKKVTDAILNNLLEYSPICNVETSYQARGGAFIPVSFSCSVMRDISGAVTGIVCVAQDITEQKLAEEKLRKSKLELMAKHEELKILFNEMEKVKKEWENVLDCVGDIVILADQEGRIRRCNKAVIAISGKRYEDILGRSWKEVLLEPEIDANACSDMGLELFHRPTGRWFQLKHYPFREFGDDNVSGMVITIHDATEVKQITEALEKAYVELKASQDKILQQEKMASIGLLAAGVAHEINNPLGFIKCNLGTLDQHTVTVKDFITAHSSLIEKHKDPEVLRNFAALREELEIDHVLKDTQELIMESLDGVERVRKIVQDLKCFSRMDEAFQVAANINECVATALNIVWNELKYKAVVKKNYGSLPTTLCYPQQLNQVFMNLLVNAGHAIENKGEISIRTWCCDDSIFISISDTGRGIPSDQVSRIFEPFFTTKKVGEGTGLGLSITYDIIKKHNGEISVTSDLGKGTLFTIRLPIVEERAMA